MFSIGSYTYSYFLQASKHLVPSELNQQSFVRDNLTWTTNNGSCDVSTPTIHLSTYTSTSPQWIETNSLFRHFNYIFLNTVNLREKIHDYRY